MTANDKNATTNKVWGYNQASTCRPMFSFSFKNITCKTFKTGVDWEKYQCFLFLRHKKTIQDICMNKVSKKLRKATENAEKN